MKKLFLYICIVLFVLLSGFFVLKNVMLWQGVYGDNRTEFSAKENKEIKTLILTAIKDRCLLNYSIDKSLLYEDEVAIPDELPQNEKSSFCIVDGHFMKTAYKDGNNYYIIVKATYPESYYYHFEVQKIDGAFKIKHFLLDV